MSTDQSNQPSDEGRVHSDAQSNAAGLKPFYSTQDGHPTVVTEADLAHTIYEAEGTAYDDLIELDRYWSVFPYSYVSICQSKKHGELRYFVVEPYLSDAEKELLTFLIDKIQSKIRNYDTQILSSNDRHRRAVIRESAIELLENYNMSTGPMIRHAHADSEYVTDEFDLDPSNLIESTVQRVLLGEDEEFSPTKIDCARHAVSHGATATYEYLHLIADLDGHPFFRARPDDGFEADDEWADTDDEFEIEDLDGDSDVEESVEGQEDEQSLADRIRSTIQDVTSKFGRGGNQKPKPKTKTETRRLNPKI